MTKDAVRIFRFIVVGSLNALIMAGVTFLMMEVLGYGYIISNVVAYTAALVNNFIWSKYWVFSSTQGKFIKEIPLFLIAFGSAFVAQFLFILLLVEFFKMNAFLAQFLGLFIYGATNFIMNKRLTFKKSEVNEIEK